MAVDTCSFSPPAEWKPTVTFIHLAAQILTGRYSHICEDIPLNERSAAQVSSEFTMILLPNQVKKEILFKRNI